MLNSSTHQAGSSKVLVPKADFYTSDESLLILVEMVGVSKDDVQVTLEKGRLLVESQDSTGEGSLRRRAFRIPEDYDTAKTAATVERGVVRLHIPKRPEAKTVRIPVNAA